MSMLKTRLSLYAQVIDWCFCALVFSCPVGNAFFALFRKAGVIVTRCRLFGASLSGHHRHAPSLDRPLVVRAPCT